MGRTLCFLLLSATLLKVAHLQPSMPRTDIGNCVLPTVADLGRSDVPSQDGLIAGGLTADGTDAGNTRPFVRIIDFQYVCQSSGTMRGTVSSVSVVVQFETCSGTEVFCADEANREAVIEQFQFNCLAVATDPNGGDPRMNVFSFDPNTISPTVRGLVRTIESRVEADLTTPLADQCGECADGTSAVGIPATDDTHCAPCSSSCLGDGQGLGRCVGVLGSQCCNFFEDDICVINCTSPLIPDSGFNCGCQELTLRSEVIPDYSDEEGSNRGSFTIRSTVTQICDAGDGFVTSGNEDTVTRTCTTSGWSGADITCQRFECPGDEIRTHPAGRVSYSPPDEPHYVGTVATFTCEGGYVLGEGGSTRRCEIGGWSGTNPTCTTLCLASDLVLENGEIAIPDPITIDSVARFECTDGRVLDGPTTRVCEAAGWSGMNPRCSGASASGSSSPCGTGCIIGIVLAVLGVIILAAILAGVAYAVYSYMNHPDTKLAKYDADNINGVAKDNPLYVDPEAVVGDGAEAA